MVHFASIRHPAAILDDLHGKVLNEAYQISKSTVTESVSAKMQTQKVLGFCFFWDIKMQLNNHLAAKLLVWLCEASLSVLNVCCHSAYD